MVAEQWSQRTELVRQQCRAFLAIEIFVAETETLEKLPEGFMELLCVFTDVQRGER